MKKIFLIITLSFIGIIIGLFSVTYGDCKTEGDIEENVKNCIEGAGFLGMNGGGTGQVVLIIRKWAVRISIYLYVGAAFGIAIGSFMLAVSRGEADKAKKAKDIILWSIIGFICVLTAYYTINLVIGLMYTL